MAAGRTEKRKGIIFSRCILSAIFIVSLTAFSCSPAQSPSDETEPSEDISQFPSDQFNKAKSLARDGYALYCRAMQEEDLTRCDEMLEKVLQEYYYPALSILSAIREKFTTGDDAVRVDRESEDLSRKIDDVVRSKGAPRGE
jgi:hypothetical protein